MQPHEQLTVLPLQTPSRSASEMNLRRLFALRNIAIAGQITAVVVATQGMGMTLPVNPMAVIIAVYALLNVLVLLRFRLARPVVAGELFGQLLIDVAALSALLYLAGGATNPFVSLFLLPLIISAAVLPMLYTWAMAGITVICYSALMLFYVPLPPVHGHDFGLHVSGMWFGFLLSAGLIAYFVARMSKTLLECDRLLATAREEVLRNERILALGTLAAGTAHELSTPLSTMAIVVTELEQDAQALPDLRERLDILREQVNRCKTALAGLSASAGQARAEAGRSQSLDQYLDEILSEWRTLRPNVALKHRFEGELPAPFVVTERILTQAIMIILNNAADASPDSVEIWAQWSPAELRIEVRDRGAGLSPEVASNIGRKPFRSTKPPGQGLGLGLFLAHTTVSRLGGKVELFNREGGGTCTRMTLPLKLLLAAA